MLTMIPKTPKFLIVKTSSLGDIIHTFPVVEYLKKNFPNSLIDWVVEAPFSQILLAHQHVDNVITSFTRKWKLKKMSRDTWKEIKNFKRILQEKEYDYAFDFQGNIKSGCILSQARAKKKIGFGIKAVSEWPNLLFTHKKYNPPKMCNVREENLFLVQKTFKESFEISEEIELNVNEEEKHQIADILKKGEDKKLILVCVGSRWPNKELSFTQLLFVLQSIAKQEKVYFLFSWGSGDEKEKSERLSALFKEFSCVLPLLAIPALQYLMKQVSLVIAMDSLPLHLCGTTKTPSLSFFGPSSPTKYLPLGGNHHNVWGKCPYKISFEKRCPHLRRCPTGSCIKDIEMSSLIPDEKLFLRSSMTPKGDVYL